MFEINRSTQKLYYDNSWLTNTDAIITKLGKDYIEFDKTVAYPEGGGQEADQGFIIVNDHKLHFINVKKMYTTEVKIENNSYIKTKGVIWHYIDIDDQCLLTSLSVGQKVSIHIDIERRALLTLNHTASHLLFLAIQEVRPSAIHKIIGCHINTTSSRFDLEIEKFSPEEIDTMASKIMQNIELNKNIKLFSDHLYTDARYWKCDEDIIPCGGTHLENTGVIRNIKLRRKSPGKNKERIICIPSNVDNHTLLKYYQL